ncbi:NADH:ubiquinone oxidoreductase subunit NDUFA12 [Candidatus Cyrtobacter comes]|uniref:NADH:ubiquinone oxidoreductase subunit NDUFA12 n=1 Tax=Candidatus Cyrtobacter comes TaxID=675776 RepID=A0ABU5L9F9_9RICK|nr:NADH-ubiquinone oxidoreductase subunit NDUFA12 family protein [Candidatus Cyrtobacter comes]MDZ5762682.1 NADH:ubiquinone oxidoreductase subunit NDUFA12 [Candidatus Cyrtobacter comes]
MSFLSKLKAKFFGKLVGKDQFANLYYETGRDRYFGRKGRVVIYNGLSEASKIPPDWFLWIHYMTDQIPSHAGVLMNKQRWMKEHMVNVTGTTLAYDPMENCAPCTRYQRWFE